MEWHVVLLESIYGLGTDVRATLIFCNQREVCKRSRVSVKVIVITEEVNTSGSSPQHLVRKTENSSRSDVLAAMENSCTLYEKHM